MIVINNRPGQLGNQLWLNAPFIALCLEHDLLYLNLYFENNYQLFEDLNVYKNIKFGLVGKTADIYLRKISLRLVTKMPAALLKSLNLFVDKASWRNERWPVEILAKKSNTVFAGGTAYPDSHKLLAKHHKAITTIFAPKKQYADRVDRFMHAIRQNAGIVIGVHIRRGDYKEFLGGVYYFEDAVYMAYMQQIAEEIEAGGKSVSFVLSSNESIYPKTFAPYNVFQLQNAASVEDMLLLSKCDYILGVPSTFSMWASYYGKVPLRFIKYDNEALHLKQFSPIIAQDQFENGDKLVHVNS